MLQEERSTPFVTKCIEEDLRKRGSSFIPALKISQSLPKLRCRHEHFKAPEKCIRLLIGAHICCVDPDRVQQMAIRTGFSWQRKTRPFAITFGRRPACPC